jgi:hypothetical protein
MPLCDANGYPLPGNVNSKLPPQTTAAEFCYWARQPLPPTTPTTPTPECPNALNQQLSITTLDVALQQHETYRPICDKDGYPLCGNLNGKVVTTASTFCKAMRDNNLL